MLFSLAFSGIELLFAYFLAHLLYLLQLSSSDPSPPFFVLAFFQTRSGSLPFLLIIGVARTLLRVQSNQSVLLFGEIVRSRLRFILFRQIYNPRSRRMAQSEINMWLAEVFPKTAEFAIAVGNFLLNAVQVCFFFAILFSNSAVKAAAGLAAILIFGPIIRFTYRYVRGLSHHVLEDVTEVQRSIVRATRNWLLIRLLRTEAMERGRLCRASLATSQKNLRIELVNALSAGLPEVAGSFVVAILIGLQYGPDQQPAAAFLTFLYVFLRFNQALVQMGGQFSLVQTNYPRFRRSAELVATVSEGELSAAISPLSDLSFFGKSRSASIDAKDAATRSVDLVHSAPTISFQSVCFSYADGPNVIRNLSFSVLAGSALGVVGPSGVGKSTLLALLMGVEIPVAGQVRLFAEGHEFEAVSHRISVGYVGPEPFLFAGSVTENLIYGSVSQLSSDAMVRALRKAGFSGTDTELTALLNSRLTEDGEGLSTGQKQRLCLARALLATPALLILDEVSANLDLMTESRIAYTVNSLRGDCTIVIVSHRDGMLEICDQILDLRSGTIKSAAQTQA